MLTLRGMLIARRAIPVLAVVLVAGCAASKPTAAPTPTPTSAGPSPSPSPSTVAAVTVDEPARRACRLLIGTKADIGEASPADPTLQQVADLLATSQHFSLRFDGQKLANELRIYRGKKGTGDENAAGSVVTQAARDLDKSCTANGAYKPQS